MLDFLAFSAILAFLFLSLAEKKEIFYKITGKIFLILKFWQKKSNEKKFDFCFRLITTNNTVLLFVQVVHLSEKAIRLHAEERLHFVDQRDFDGSFHPVEYQRADAHVATAEEDQAQVEQSVFHFLRIVFENRWGERALADQLGRQFMHTIIIEQPPSPR